MNYLSEEIQEEIVKQNFTEEQKELIEKIIANVNFLNGYRIRVGRKYKIIVQTWEDYKYYKIAVYSKDIDGHQKTAFKQLKFVCDVPDLKTGDEIIIKSMFEDFYYSRNDKDKYNAHYNIVVKDFEFALKGLVEEKEERTAINDFAFDDDDLLF